MKLVVICPPVSGQIVAKLKSLIRQREAEKELPPSAPSLWQLGPKE